MQSMTRTARALIRLVGLIAAGACLVASVPAAAQGPARVARIGVLWPTSPPPPVHPHVEGMLKGLQDIGLQDGKTVALEYRYGGNDSRRLGELAADLVRVRVDLIVTLGDIATRAAQKATTSIPIVALVGFPVESGFVQSLARPGGNITGVAVIADELSVKRLEILKELLPKQNRVAVFWDPVTHERQRKAVESAGPRLGLQLQIIRVSPNEIQGAFEAAVAARAESILVLVSPMLLDNQAAIVRLASQHRIPAIYFQPPFVDAGGLMSYGPSLKETWGLMAGTITKLLKGARAAELPVQQPTRFELDVNLKAAREIGIEVPQSILLRANRVIE
jgi:putative ABC transport system substrate-binding protein